MAGAGWSRVLLARTPDWHPLLALLQADAGRYTWVAAVVGANQASAISSAPTRR